MGEGMFCTSCQKGNPAEARFCMACGARLTSHSYRFDDLAGGLPRDGAIAAFFDGCHGPKRLFAPSTWRTKATETLHSLLPDPITQDQATALRQAVLKEIHYEDDLVKWL